MTHDTMTLIKDCSAAKHNKGWVTYWVSYHSLKCEKKLLERCEQGEVDRGKTANCHRRDTVEKTVNVGDVIVSIRCKEDPREDQWCCRAENRDERSENNLGV